MGQTFSQLNFHLVFSTKDRIPYLNEEIRNDLFPYLVLQFAITVTYEKNRPRISRMTRMARY